MLNLARAQQRFNHLCARAMLSLAFLMLGTTAAKSVAAEGDTRASHPTNQIVHTRGILSLDLCVDWMLAYFAAPTQVQALSPIHPKYPSPLLTHNPKAQQWPSHEGEIESIVQLNPQIILVSEYNAWTLRARLQQLNFSVLIFKHPTTLTDIVDYQRQFLRGIGLPDKLAVPLPPAAAPRADNARLLVLGENGIGAGRGSFEDSVITHAGWRNYLSEPGNVHLNIEQLVQDPPDAILFSAPQSPALANQFAAQPALRKVIPPSRWIASDHWHWMCPGPWTWDLIDQLSSIELPPQH